MEANDAAAMGSKRARDNNNTENYADSTATAAAAASNPIHAGVLFAPAPACGGQLVNNKPNNELATTTCTQSSSETNSPNRSKYRHQSTPYLHDTISDTDHKLLERQRNLSGSRLDYQELDLTPRLLLPLTAGGRPRRDPKFSPRDDNRTLYSLLSYSQQTSRCPVDPIDVETSKYDSSTNKGQTTESAIHNESLLSDDSSFCSPPITVAAVYEQPALNSRAALSAQFKSSILGFNNNLKTTTNRSVSTFKQINSAIRQRAGTSENITSNRNTRQQTNNGHRGRNSLESIQSRYSISSSGAGAGGVSPDNANDDGQLSRAASPVGLTRGNHSVLVGTRYVSPPEVPPVPFLQSYELQAACPQGIETSPSPVDCEWREVPLEETSERPQAIWRKKRSLVSSLMKSFRQTKEQESEVPSLEKYKLDNNASAVNSALKSSKNIRSNDLPQCPIESSEKEAHRHDNWNAEQRTGANLTNSNRSSDGNSGFEKSNKKTSLSNDKRRPNASLDETQIVEPQRQIGKTRPPFMFAGILGSVLGSLFLSLGMLTIKLLPDDHGLVEKTKIVCFRGISIMIFCAGTIFYQGSTFIVRRDELLVNALRSVLGFTGVYAAYISLKYISMGDSTALIFSSPIWTSLLSHFILNEPLQWIQLLALPLSILGIILIAHPSLLINMDHTAGFNERQPLIELVETLPSSSAFVELYPSNSTQLNSTTQQHFLQLITTNSSQQLNQDLDISMNTSEHFDYEHRWKGILISLGASFIVSFVYIVLKFRKTTPIQTTTFWLGFTTFFGALIVSSIIGFGEMPHGWYEWSLILLNGICSWLGQCFLQWGLKYEDASVLSVVRTLDVALMFTLSALFLDEEILWTSVLGASIIAGVVVSIMLNNYISSRLCPNKSNVDESATTRDTNATQVPGRQSQVNLS